MREIKFRYFQQIKENGKQYDEMISWEEMIEEGLELFFDKPDKNVMQYTGLKDKNGKEIYEGDLLQSFNSAPRPVTFTDFEWKIGNTALHTFESEDYEIIGNIYETPELLTNKN